MSTHQPLSQVLEACKGAQQIFWSAAGAAPAGPDHEIFLGADWPEIDPATPGSPWADAAATAQVFQRLNTRTWLRIARDFELWRSSLGEARADVPWQTIRARWFAIAEAEFRRTQRSDDFLAAVAGAVRVAADHLAAMTPEQRGQFRGLLQATARARRAVVGAALTGVEIAATPKQQIWRLGEITVSRYVPLTRGPNPALGPVLICHGLIGRQTMTDLLPERSMVRQLLTSGVDVFVLDWGGAGQDRQGPDLDAIARFVLPAALDRVIAESGAARAILMGICQGGTLAAVAATLSQQKLAGLITAVAPFDFHADTEDTDPSHGLMHLWTRAPALEDLERLLDLSGDLPGDLLGLLFDQLNPSGTLAKYAVKLLDSGEEPGKLRLFLAMERWLADRPDLPAALARTWLVDLYRHNQLADGSLKIDGKVVSLDRLRLPVLNVVAANDHIVPPPCSRALQRLAPAAAYRELTLPTGHIGAFVSSKSQAVLAPEIARWLQQVRQESISQA